MEPSIQPSDMQTDSPRVIVIRDGGRSTARWLMVVLLTVIATVLVMRWGDEAGSKPAWAQTAFPGGGVQAAGRGIYAFAGQIGSRNYGLYMLDMDTGTVWCYEVARGTFEEPHLKLVAARSWIYDRYLEEFNVASPTPAEVQKLVEQQQTAKRGPSPSVPTHSGSQDDSELFTPWEAAPLETRPE